MRFIVLGKYLLIVLSGLVLVINFIYIQHSSTLYHKYYKDLSRQKFIHDYQHSVQDSVDNTEPFQLKSMPIFHVMDRYTKYDDLIPRRAYYTRLFIDGVYQRVVTVLAEVNAKIIQQDLIEACQLDGQYSTSIKVVPDPIKRWVQTYKKGYTHFFAIIYCFGLRKRNSKHSNVISLIYRTGGNASYRSVNTENALCDLNEREHPKKGSLVVCATMYGHPVRFDEWLRYQKTIGVDTIHMNAQVSFVASMEQYPFLMESLANGFVKLEVWKEYLKDIIFYHSQSLIYQDCVLQYQHRFEYAMLIDYDDFFIPVISNKNNIHYYLELFFADEKTASVAVPWIQYHCEPLNYTKLVDGNLTRALSGQNSDKRLESKSIHKLDMVEIVSIHKAYKTVSGYSIGKLYGIYQGYFAHIKPNKRKCKPLKA